MKHVEDDNKKFWQRFAGQYEVMMNSSRKLYDAIADKMRPELKKEMNVLELACGTGQLSFRLAGWVHLWEATDFSEAMIAEAKKREGSARLHFSVQDATCLPYAENSFDAVVISNALHIMPCPEKALEEIRRVLKPGGLLFAPTFVWGERKKAGFRIRLMELAGFRTYHKWKAEELAAFVKQNGSAVTEQGLLGGGIIPLCYLEARYTGRDEKQLLDSGFAKTRRKIECRS